MKRYKKLFYGLLGFISVVLAIAILAMLVRWDSESRNNRNYPSQTQVAGVVTNMAKVKLGIYTGTLPITLDTPPSVD